MGAELDIVIVNWNAGELLGEAIAALAESDDAARLSVVVVDNASLDGSADALPRGELAVTLLRNRENRGFGAASNQGAAAGDAAVILFLNPDTRVQRDTLRLALDHLAAYPEIGILGVRQTDEAGRTLRTSARRPSVAGLIGQAFGLDRLGLVRPHFMTEWDHADTREVDQVMGSFLMIRRPLFARLGGFDERFFVYYEDVDLCARAARAGASVVHLAGAAIYHRTQGTTAQVKDRRLFYYLRSQALYVAKHHGRAAASLLLAVDLGVQVPLRILRELARGRLRDAGAVLRAARMLVADMPAIRRASRQPDLRSA